MSDTRADQQANPSAVSSGPNDVSALRRTDAELATASGRGDSTAFGELVLRHQDRAFNLAFRLTGSHEDAADAVQEAFLKAYRGVQSFRQQSSFYTWLFRIVVNEVRSRRRSGASRHPGFSLDAANGRSAAGDPADPPAGVQSNEPDPSEQASLKERRRIVEEALQALEFDQRAIIALRDIEGRDYAEIAEVLGCPQGTVKSRLHRARLALKDALAPKLGPPPE
jgi:RNA polymerase sigma-70 factor (ECF subfamily)